MSITNIDEAKRNAWRRGLLLGGKNKTPKRCLANVLHVLAMHPDWADVITYDAFAECVVCTKEPPAREQDRPSHSTIGDWTDEHSIRTAAWFAKEIGFEPTVTHVEQAIAAVARKRTVHPVREWLLAAEWDGVKRLDTVLSSYFGTDDTPYTRAVGAKWMISAVARIMRPGCQADCMLVLEGRQGQRKSTGLEALCARSEWFADTGISIGDKDSYQSLRRKWIYEFGELDAIKGREVTKVKNFVSARSDNYRPSYGRHQRDFPRQVVFAGTTNEDHYLADKTGNRRFWPVRCHRPVDVDAIRRDRTLLWAEARLRFESGERWFVDTPELHQLCEAEQQEREVPDDWEPIVATWLGRPSTAHGPRDLLDGVTTQEALTNAIGMKPAEIGPAHTSRMGRVFKALQLKKSKNPVYRDGIRVRLYRQAVSAVSESVST